MSNELISLCGIEGIPLITRFKTLSENPPFLTAKFCIEGIPLITRFKTKSLGVVGGISQGIEGIPLITRFKTKISFLSTLYPLLY